MVAKAVAGAEQQHGLALELLGADGLALGQWMRGRQRDNKRLVVQRRDRQPRVGKGLGHDGAVQLAGAQHLQQLHGEVLLQHQRHLRVEVDGVAHQFGQQVRTDGVDQPEAQRTGQRVLAALGDLLDRAGLVEHGLGLAHDLLAQRCHGDLAAAALEDLQVQLLFELLDRDRQGRLGHEAGLGRAAEMALAGHGDDVAQLGQGHGGGTLSGRDSNATLRPLRRKPQGFPGIAPDFIERSP
mmetsp:Transcript_53129/g.124294  ORF Transcript_53129/g.124294 Transcript_53129/m.124294 type:complete len:240 (-) Transcript_53129:1084-1803(-)